MIDLLLIFGGVVLGGMVIYLRINLLLIGDLEDAVERTVESVSGFVIGIFSAGLIVAVEIGTLIAQFGDLIGMVAGTFSAGVITILGVSSLSGLIDISPELFSLLAVVTIVGAHAMGDG
jgi:hypothetical protein